ncbi:unnamed protein product [Auanema sp. JU1783]|nr:unnamed protein product [Auanema sp. JU1783]
MLSALLTASQFCASDGTDNPPVWNDSDVCEEDAFKNLGTPPLMNASTGTNFVKHDCSIAVILDLDKRLTSEENYGNVLLFIKGMVNTCMNRGIGYRSYFYSMFNENGVQTICCEEKACSFQIAFMAYDDYVGTYDSINPIQVDPTDGNFTYALLGDLKVFASKDTKCLYNNVVLLTQRIFQYQDGLPADIVQVVDFGCITFTIIAVGNPDITTDLLTTHYHNLTDNLYVVPDFNCLPNLDDCIKPCSPRTTAECLSRELSNCPAPTSSTYPSTIVSTTLTPTTEMNNEFVEYSHFIYLFALSNRTTPGQFDNAVNYVLEPLKQCLNDKAKILVRFLARNNSDSLWLENYNDIRNHLEALRSDEVLLDASRAIDVYENTTLALVKRGTSIPINQDQKIGEPRLTLLTDFASQNFIDAYHTDDGLIRALGRFDFEIYCYDSLAAEIYKNETLNPAHVHSDPDFSTNKNELVSICPNKKKSSIPTIMIIVVGATVVIMLLLIVVTILYRRKYIWMERIHKFRSNLPNSESNENSEEPIIDYYELSEDKVIVKNELAGRGAQGSVNIAKLIGSSPAIEKYLPNERDNYTDIDCVVKMVQPSSKEAFLREINIMKHIGYHDHIVRMLGCVTTSKYCQLVLEFCNDKDLLRLLERKKKEIENNKWFDDELDFCNKQLLPLAHQVAQGMDFLGRKKVVHRDLAARNILIHSVGSILTAKISDFGLALILETDHVIASNDVKVPIKWTAVEALVRGEFSLRSDVWSFGMLLYEMYSMGKPPFADVDLGNVTNHVKDGNRPSKPLLASDRMGELMIKCWEENPADRPTFRDLETQLAIQLEQSAEGYGYLALVKSDEHYRILPNREAPIAPSIREREMPTYYCDDPTTSNFTQQISIDGNPHVDPLAFRRKRSQSQLTLKVDALEVPGNPSVGGSSFRSAFPRRKSQISSFNPFKIIRNLTKTSNGRRGSEP